MEDLERLVNTHRAVVEEFTQRVVSTLGDQVESVILYGSVARGDDGPESDIDILVVCPNTKYCWDGVSDVADDIVYQNGYVFACLRGLLQPGRLRRVEADRIAIHQERTG